MYLSEIISVSQMHQLCNTQVDIIKFSNFNISENPKKQTFSKKSFLLK